MMTQYKDDDDDDAQLNALLDAMEGIDANHLATVQKPQGATVVELHIHPAGESATKPEEEEVPETNGEEGMLPTPEELEEMMRGMA